MFKSILRMAADPVIFDDSTRSIGNAGEGSSMLDGESTTERPTDACYIVRLPAELLIQIFKLIASDDRFDRGRYITSGQPRCLRLGFILVTHVCRHWREIALRSPILWCNIYDTNFDGKLPVGMPPLEEQLLRSQSSPISWTISLPSPPHQMTFLSQHTFHLGQLTVSRRHGDLEEFIRMGLTEPAPTLESLVIVDHQQMEQTVKALPSNIFAGCIPRLQRLFLCILRLPWLLPNLNNLTELTVDFTIYNRPITIPRFIHSPTDGGLLSTESLLHDALCKMTSLRKLALMFCLSTPSSSRTREIIEMPYLQELQLVTIPARPAGYAVRVVSLDDRSFGFSLVGISANGYHEMVLRDVAWYMSLSAANHTRVCVYSVDADAAPEGWCSFSLLHNLFKAMPSMQVHTLALYSLGSKAQYFELLPSLKVFPNVKHLHLISESMVPLIIAWSPDLAQWLDSPEPTAADVHILPGLVSLSLIEVDLSQGVSGMSYHEALWKALIKRKNAGLPLQQLSLIRCMVDAAWMRIYEGVVSVSTEGRVNY
ncbi:hypothetical protein EVG20_g3873 [Dentipellis fragilis]|uniref:F-box domain-containing protein n=1 Tax=Dentipellis fragilis TaxID=205917 RepID=A0A4Y9Z0V2_9AGAM|nr:hypothetical protein EVG20_g3873 [Dentipellis fragilis]